MKNKFLLIATITVALGLLVWGVSSNDRKSVEANSSSAVSQAVSTPVRNGASLTMQKKSTSVAAAMSPLHSDASWTHAAYVPPRFRQSKSPLQNDPNDEEQMPEEARLLRDMSQSEESAIGQIFILIDGMRGIANQGYYSTGDNIDVTDSLLGKNYRKVAYLPENHPRINGAGEITDRWGSPYHFHFLSSTDVTIRSYGPDKEPFTGDDIAQNMAGEAVELALPEESLN